MVEKFGRMICRIENVRGRLASKKLTFLMYDFNWVLFFSPLFPVIDLCFGLRVLGVMRFGLFSFNFVPG